MGELLKAGYTSVQKTSKAEEPVVFLHCSASSAKQWSEFIDKLPSGYKSVTIELLGHGVNPAWRGIGPMSLQAEIESIFPLVKRLDARVHVVGHSYGGAIALQFALEHLDYLTTLTLLEPSSFHILRENQCDAEFLVEIEEIKQKFFDRILSGDLHGAMSMFIDYWSTPGTWNELSEQKKDTLASQAVLVAHHFSGLMEANTPISSYAKIDIPTLILCGTKSPRPSRLITRLLANAMPNARHRTIAWANHMALVARPEIVNPLILDHIGRLSYRSE
jgi:pimeloyl-ACP methyl ester carboxylesterase